MTTLTATTARREFFDLVKGAAEGHRTFRIQHRKGTAVLISEEDYEGLLETMELLSLPGFRRRLKASIKQMKAGTTVSMDELFGEKK
ncbi:MAG: type II toxin-antitoxin system prevent-host-death family antitoxin [Verrucomicrobia bacterium]|nr:type II toxin-antitoxin system prevent-host-death family antitoxin [Verrucomicrobiota bacterium]